MVTSFNPRGDTLAGFTSELEAAVEADRYEPAEIERATTVIIRSEEYFPKVSQFLRVLERVRMRQTNRRASEAVGVGDPVDLDHAVLMGWVIGWTLDNPLYRRVAPLRFNAPPEAWPALSQQDELVPGWLEAHCQPRAVARFLDDLSRANALPERGEPDRVRYLRDAVKLNLNDLVNGLTPSARVKLIERRMAELRRERAH